MWTACPSVPLSLDLEVQSLQEASRPRGLACPSTDPAGGGCGKHWQLRPSGPAQPLSPIPALQLFDLIYREETLFNVIKSVTRNGRSILLTALLALILVYLFSIVGFLFLKDDFILEVDRLPSNHSRGLGPSGGVGGSCPSDCARPGPGPA